MSYKQKDRCLEMLTGRGKRTVRVAKLTNALDSRVKKLVDPARM